MTFTRRRWDLRILVGAVLTTAAGAAQVLAFEEPPTRFASGVVMLPLWLLRFWIPPEGERRRTYRDLLPEERRLVVWCAGWLLGLLPWVAFLRACFGPADRWPLGPTIAAACAQFAATLALASRADRARKRLRNDPPNVRSAGGLD